MYSTYHLFYCPLIICKEWEEMSSFSGQIYSYDQSVLLKSLDQEEMMDVESEIFLRDIWGDYFNAQQYWMPVCLADCGKFIEELPVIAEGRLQCNSNCFQTANDLESQKHYAD